MNGDGYADVVVGAPGYNSNQGRAYVYTGSAGGLSASPALTLTGEATSDLFSFSVATAGDVDGDGYADLIIGAFGYLSYTGRAYVYPGNGGWGRTVLARQGASGSWQPVQPWGLSRLKEGFQVSLVATDPHGRGRVKLQVQACPPGVPFGHPSCLSHTSAAWTDVTATPGGVTLIETISGLSGTLYRWRARVLYASYSVTAAGIRPPPNPAHGPWRRLLGQALEADIRIGVYRIIYLPLIRR